MKSVLKRGNVIMDNEIKNVFFDIEMLRRRLIRPFFIELGLTVGQGQPRILKELREHGIMNQKELADACLMDVTTMSRTLDRMEKDGLLKRENNPVSRRSWMCYLLIMAARRLMKLSGYLTESIMLYIMDSVKKRCRHYLLWQAKLRKTSGRQLRMKSRNKLIIRWVFYLLGLLILALGIMLNTKANLGVSPIISVPYSISHIIGFNFANMTMIVYFIFVLIEMIMHTVWYLTDRKEAKYLGMYIIRDALQIPVSIVFTRFLNVFSALIPSVHNNIVLQIVVLLLAVLLTGIGAAMSLNMRIIPNPGDGIVQAISDTTRLKGRTGKGVGFCKNCFDIFNVCTTFLIGLFTGHILLGLGLGTILSMIGVGRVIAVFNKLFKERMKAVAFDYVEE